MKKAYIFNFGYSSSRQSEVRFFFFLDLNCSANKKINERKQAKKKKEKKTPVGAPALLIESYSFFFPLLSSILSFLFFLPSFLPSLFSFFSPSPHPWCSCYSLQFPFFFLPPPP
eukprot:TRINITY_DN2277_c0_g1_i1.p1 TRINITY_DN2277_c0_g1~~TRINITY_DN2277_c0_g1_i1.p1  ORF type:complete len:114 (+),score=4.46 TRINITY_DN2277_c0_g1_i1:267-608(+)